MWRLGNHVDVAACCTPADIGTCRRQVAEHFHLFEIENVAPDETVVADAINEKMLLEALNTRRLNISPPVLR